VELDQTELGEQPARVAAVSSVRFAAFGHALEVAIDRLGHAAFEQLGERLPGGGPIILAPFHALGLHGLHHRECCW
jgi:hypothetical protein